LKGILIGRDARKNSFHACVACQSKTEDADVEFQEIPKADLWVFQIANDRDTLASRLIALCHFDK